jgi:hypothetical protein
MKTQKLTESKQREMAFRIHSSAKAAVWEGLLFNESELVETGREFRCVSDKEGYAKEWACAFKIGEKYMEYDESPISAPLTSHCKEALKELEGIQITEPDLQTVKDQCKMVLEQHNKVLFLKGSLVSERTYFVDADCFELV